MTEFTIDMVAAGYSDYVLTSITLGGNNVTNIFAISGDAIIVPVPEPSSLLLLSLGGVGMIRVTRRRGK